MVDVYKFCSIFLFFKRLKAFLAEIVSSQVRNQSALETEARSRDSCVCTVAHRWNYPNILIRNLVRKAHANLATLAVDRAMHRRFFYSYKGIGDCIPDCDKIVSHGYIIPLYHHLE